MQHPRPGSWSRQPRAGAGPGRGGLQRRAPALGQRRDDRWRWADGASADSPGLCTLGPRAWSSVPYPPEPAGRLCFPRSYRSPVPLFLKGPRLPAACRARIWPTGEQRWCRGGPKGSSCGPRTRSWQQRAHLEAVRKGELKSQDYRLDNSSGGGREDWNKDFIPLKGL